MIVFIEATRLFQAYMAPRTIIIRIIKIARTAPQDCCVTVDTGGVFDSESE